jgi:hypothetical protein
MADKIRMFEDDRLIACHQVLDGCRQRSLLEGHRHSRNPQSQAPIPPAFNGDLVALRPLDIYEAVGRRLAASGNAA